jgi:hypothetical protein
MSIAWQDFLPGLLTLLAIGAIAPIMAIPKKNERFWTALQFLLLFVILVFLMLALLASPRRLPAADWDFHLSLESADTNLGRA